MLTAKPKDKYIIWSDKYDRLDEWFEELKKENPNLPEGEVYELMQEINLDYLEDERVNLDIELPEEIVVIADLGLWNGRKMGYKEIPSGNIKDCLYSNTDTTEWYVDRYGDLRADAYHHDGTNHYLYRVYRDDVSEMQKDNFRDKLFEGIATRRDINRVTKRLGDEIGKVYGWEFKSPSIDRGER